MKEGRKMDEGKGRKEGRKEGRMMEGMGWEGKGGRG